MSDNHSGVSPDRFLDETADENYAPWSWSKGERVHFAAGALRGARGEIVDCTDAGGTIIVTLSGCLPGVFVSVNARYLERP